MRNIFLVLLTLGTCMAGLAQQVPANLPPPKPGPNLPSPKLKVYSPADLTITNVSLHSITRNDPHAAYVVTLNVSIRNSGETGSNPITKIKGFTAQAAGRYKAPTPYPKGANDPGDRIPFPWTYVGTESALPRVDGGASWGGDITFEVRYVDVNQNGKFYVLLLADFYNNTQESNEANNYSEPILITPPSH
ncbi:MAG: hypothetical protein JST68_10460 [Bacteroidetes bacterium]|nr:hypothetical protein [Bacteroidota bacterium]